MTPTRMRPTTRYRPSSGVAHREIEGQTLLMAGDEDGLLTLNSTGQFIWRRIVRNADVQTIVRAFAREFRLAPEIADRDVVEFLLMLERRRMIRRG